MATITLIQGTDSLSASRVTLNENFDALNDELGLLTSKLDPTASTLSNMTSVSTDALDITGAASFASALITLSTVTDVEELININGGISFESENIAGAMPGPLGYTASTYFVAVGNAALTQGQPGQEITLIADGIQVTVDTSLVPGYGSIVLDPNGSVTLRYYGSEWYVINASPKYAALS